MSEPFVAYAVQKYPALRTTFIRREVEALRKMGRRIEVFSMRPVQADSLHGDGEALSHVAATHFLPANPLSPRAMAANLVWVMRRPIVTLRNIRLALADAGKYGRFKRLRLALQVWRAAPMASMLRRAGRCTHIHAHFADGAATTALAASRLLGVPFSFTSHTSHDSPALAEKMTEATFIASISEFDRRRLIEETDANAACIHIIRCGVPLEQWPFTPRPAMHDPLRIVSVGALIETKGHDVLVRACRVLRDRGLRIQCEIIGGGSMLEELGLLISQLHLEADVRLEGALPQEQTRKRLETSDIFVLACRRARNGDTEGMPVSIMEAMAVGLPVVSCRIAGLPELITDGQTGFLAEPGDSASLAQKIEQLMGANRLLISKNARAFLERHFSATTEAEAIAGLFDGAHPSAAHSRSSHVAKAAATS